MIVEPTTLAVFALASLALNLTPGPDMLYALGRSATQGPRAGFAAAFGNLAGTLVHTAALLLGLSAALAASAQAMEVVRWFGAGVLVVIGLRMLLHRATPLTSDGVELTQASLVRVGFESFTIHTLNPKTAVFFLAFVPQFVEAGLGAASVAAQTALLGLWFAAQAALVLVLVSLMAGFAGSRLRRGPSLTGLKRGVGALLVVLGARLAFR